MLGSWSRLIFACLPAALLAACAGPSSPPPVADPAAACLRGLDERHVVYDRVPDWKTAEGCGIESAVRVRQSAIAWNRAGLMTCSMATTLWTFESQVVQPAAQRRFGHNVRKISHAGTYDCRAQRGGHPGRLSEHAFGRAMDILGFELDDGTVVSVLRDWRGHGAKSLFLHDVAEGACQVFSVVITPNRNALHRDHLHLDIGPYKLCGY